jgi:hypothetical protein
VVITLQRPDLGPAAIGKLGGKDIVHAPQKRRAIGCILLGARRSGDFCEKTQLGGGSAVVERAHIGPGAVPRQGVTEPVQMKRSALAGKMLAGRAPMSGHIQVLAPSARRGLKRNHNLGDAPALGQAIPLWRLIQAQAIRRATGRRHQGFLEPVLFHLLEQDRLVRLQLPL